MSPPGPDRSHPDRTGHFRTPPKTPVWGGRSCSTVGPPQKPRSGVVSFVGPPQKTRSGVVYLWPTGRPGPGTGRAPILVEELEYTCLLKSTFTEASHVRGLDMDEVDFFDESLESLETWISHFQVSQDLDESLSSLSRLG